jgi:Cytochrome P460
MRQILLVLIAVEVLASVAAYAAHASEQSTAQLAPTSATTTPSGYRDWQLISVAHEGGRLDDLRAILGNDVAFSAAQKGKLPYPDGSIVARVAWNYVALPMITKGPELLQPYVAGAPKNGVQFMIKDTKKYASTGGWGFAQFNPGDPRNVAMAGTCYACHTLVKSRDFVFNNYAP